MLEPRTERGKRLMEISVILSVEYAKALSLSVYLSRVSVDLKQMEIDLTPPGGWPGKNENERKAEREHALVSNPEYHNLQQSVTDKKERLDEVQYQITILETERRALEWCIRDEMVATRYSFFEDDVEELETEQAREYRTTGTGPVDRV